MPNHESKADCVEDEDFIDRNIRATDLEQGRLIDVYDCAVCGREDIEKHFDRETEEFIEYVY